jgi:hypothetical protein
MKRFTVIAALFNVGILAMCVFFEAFAASSAETKSYNTPIMVLNENDEMLNVFQLREMAVPVICADMKIAPVFDTTGRIVSDPTGTLLSVIHPGDMAVPVMCADMKVAPVFDAIGAVVSDPTGTVFSANNSEDMAVAVMNADVKVAPVFDATGAIVSDPTGTVLNANQSGNDSSSDEFRYEDCTRIRSNRRDFTRSGRYHIPCDPIRR